MLRTSKALLALTLGTSWTGVASLPQAAPPSSRPQADGACGTELESRGTALLQASRTISQLAVADRQHKNASESAPSASGTAAPPLSIAEVGNRDVVFPPLQSEEEFAHDFPNDDNPEVNPAQAQASPAPPPFTPHSVDGPSANQEAIDRLKQVLETARENANRSTTARDGLSDVWDTAQAAMETDKANLKDVSDNLDEVTGEIQDASDELDKVTGELKDAREALETGTKERASLQDEKQALNETLANETATERRAHEALERGMANARSDEQMVKELEGRLKKLAPEEAGGPQTLLASAAALLCAVVSAQSP